MLNEFFNELAYNPGRNRGGFIFFLDWANHNLNSVVSSADAHGPLGHSLVYFNCNVAPLLAPTAKINPTVNLVVGLLNPPSKATCQSAGLIGTGASAASVRTARSARSRASSGVFSGLSARVFGRGARELAPPFLPGTRGGAG